MTPFAHLVSVVARLRAPDGCPWDREQTHLSLREYLLEEAYELLDAIDQGDDGELCEELGDLLLQILLHAEIARGDGRFDIDDVCRAISDKLVSRHPHVFGEVEGVHTAAQVLPVWEARKRAEAGKERDSTLDGVPRHLPALARGLKLQRRAARVGFDWPDQTSRLAKIAEELGELAEALEAGDLAHAEAEFGDLLFMMVNVGRGYGLQAEDALRRANAKFERRFRDMEEQAGGPMAFAELDLEQQDRLWTAAKASEG